MILGVLSNADALFLAAAVPVIGGIGYNIWQNHQARTAADLLAAEFKPNGGSSIKDVLNRLEKTVGALHAGQDDLRAGQGDLRQRIATVESYCPACPWAQSVKVTNPKPTP